MGTCCSRQTLSSEDIDRLILAAASNPEILADLQRRLGNLPPPYTQSQPQGYAPSLGSIDRQSAEVARRFNESELKDVFTLGSPLMLGGQTVAWSISIKRDAPVLYQQADHWQLASRFGLALRVDDGGRSYAPPEYFISLA